MLIYLDNAQNAANRINENYARELMELHTLAWTAATQRDVQELARVSPASAPTSTAKCQSSSRDATTMATSCCSGAPSAGAVQPKWTRHSICWRGTPPRRAHLQEGSTLSCLR